MDKTNPKEILGATKPMLGLNPAVALLWMAKAFEFGAYGRDAQGNQVREKGYGEYNWRETTIAEMVYVHAMQRHMLDYLDGEDLASDSKVKHLGHIMACCAILLDAEECGTLKRNRPKPGKAASLIERMTIKKPAVAETITIDFAKTFQRISNLSPEAFEAEYQKAYKKFLADQYSNLEKEYLHDAGPEFFEPPTDFFSSERRVKSRGQVKADHHGRRRKARK